ncbi:MAG: class I SAM-dependent methyltransferase [Burkholderiaceae bacterium]
MSASTHPTLPAPTPPPCITWTEGDQPHSALWHSERGAPAPKRVVLADDTMNADTAYRLACEGVGLLWQGDFQNARMLVQALARRTDRLPERQQFKANKQSARMATKQAAKAASALPSPTSTAATEPQDALASSPATASTVQSRAAEAFHHHRLNQSQRARVLGMVLVPLDGAYQITLRRAPEVQAACIEVWGPLDPATTAAAQARLLANQQAAGLVAKPSTGPAEQPFIETFDEPGPPAKLSKFEQKIIKESKGQVTHVTSLRELLGMTSSHEWRKKGVEVPALGNPPEHTLYDRIHPHYGVFSPVRGEYVGLVAKAPLPVSAASKASLIAWDIGTGTGVLAAMLARRGLQLIVATDQDPRALACAADNVARLGVAAQVQVVQADLFPPGKAHLIVCNPPWLPARPGSPIERAVYDEGSQMLLGFLNGLPAHLAKGGEGWLVLSDIAEHLGLRTRAELLAAFDAAGLKVVARLQTKPQHAKVQDASDPLHVARAAEVTSLWRLTVA